MFPIGDSVQRDQRPFVVWCLIGLNALAFLYQITLSQTETAAFLREFALVPRRLTDWPWARASGLQPGAVLPFLTSMFLHGGVLHIVLNMWTLYIFGPALEDRLGRGRFVALYLIAGLAAGLLHVLTNWSSAIPTLGASGAIAGLIAAYALRFPFAWVNVVVPVLFIPVFFTLPATLFAGIWFLTQVLQGTTALFAPSQGGGIAWWAHIGGFAAGWAMLRLVDRGPRVTMPGRRARTVPDDDRQLPWPFSAWWTWATWWWPRPPGR